MRTTAELKRMAREKLTNRLGILSGATVIYFAIGIGIAMVLLMAYGMNLATSGVFNSMEDMQRYVISMQSSVSYTLITNGVMLLVGALLSVFSTGVMYMCLKASRGQELKIEDMFFVIKNNPDKVIVICIIQSIAGILFNLPSDLIAIKYDPMLTVVRIQIIYYALSLIGFIGSMLVNVLMSQALFLYLDDPQESIIKYIEASGKVMVSNIGRYIGLELSFIPLFIAGAFTLGIGFIWIFPYYNTVLALFYMQLKGELGSKIDVKA